MVELLDYFGDDLTIVNVARVSYGKETQEFLEKDARLIKYLYEHGHTSPFRHASLRFRVSCPIYVERQLFKHNIGISTNSISGRYVDFSDTYTKVSKWRKQSKSSKQGSEGEIENQEEASAIENNIIEICKKAYLDLINLGVSKEQARTVLPLNLNTTFIWTGSLQAFLHMCSLRLKPDAQYETRIIVQQMLDLVQNIEGQPFKYTLEAWGYK